MELCGARAADRSSRTHWRRLRDPAMFNKAHAAGIGRDGSNDPSPQRCQIDAAVLQPRCQPGSHGRSGRNANCDSESRSGPKRTESGLKKIRLAVSLWPSFSCTMAFLDIPRMRTKSGLGIIADSD